MREAKAAGMNGNDELGKAILTGVGVKKVSR